MADLNHVSLVGRLTRDAEMKYTSEGQAVSNFSIAVNRNKKNGNNWENEASFFDVVLFGKQAGSINQYLLKGRQVAVSGELRQDRWRQQDGQNRSKIVVNANTVQLLGSGENQQNNTAPKQTADPYDNPDFILF